MILGKSETDLKHTSQNEIYGAVSEQIFEGLHIEAKIEAIVEKYAEEVLPYAGSMDAARITARKWAVQSLADSVAAIARYELMLIE